MRPGGGKEKWSKIPGFNQVFIVSDQGRVKRLSDGTCHPNYGKDKLLTPQKGGRHICLWYYGTGVSSISIASLVLLAFVGPAPEGKSLALHNDDDCSNNTLTNLKWGSKKDNSSDALRNGRTNKGVPCPQWQREAISKKLRGKPLSEQTKLRMSKAVRKPKTREHRLALSEALKNHHKKRRAA